MSTAISYVDKLPTEIWLRCWIHCPKRHLRRLSRVCHYFHNLCLPLLFQDQSFVAPYPADIDSENWIDITRGLHRTYLRLGKLAASTHASCVRTWHFHGSTDLPYEHMVIANIHLVRETYLKVYHRFRSSLGCFHKLQSLTLNSIVVNADLRETIASLKHLENLTLNSCIMACSSGSLLSLRKLTVSGPRARTSELKGDPLELVSPAALSCLKVDGSSSGLHILQSFGGHTLTLLVDLTIYLTPPIAELFFASIVATACPRLEVLHVTHVSRSTALPDHIASTALPLLHSFKGPLVLLHLFIPGRPVTSIRVSGPVTATTPQILAALAALAQSTAAPHTLELHPRIAGAPEVFAALAALHALRRLSLELDQPARFWPPLAVHTDPLTEDESASEPEWADEVDERTVELSDDGSLESVESDVSYAPPAGHTSGPSELPSTDQPGYMYGRSGKEFPPPPDAEADDADDPEQFPAVLAALCAGRLALPPHLEALCFRQPSARGPGGFALSEQHRALLRLGSLSALREIAFTRSSGSTWVRAGRGGVWTQRASGNRVVAEAAV